MNVCKLIRNTNKKFEVQRKCATKEIRQVRISKKRLFGGLFLISGVGFGLYCYGSYLEEERIEKEKEHKLEQERLEIISNYKDLVAKYQTENEITYGWRFKISLYFRYIQIFILVLPAISLYYFNTIIKSDSMTNYLWQYMGFVSQSLGGLWIKVGQWASTRPDLFSPESVAKIGDLVDRCPMHSFEETQRVILDQFSINNLNELFEKFDVTPIASGAIAQVYEAYLHGEKVAVKILHPGIFELIERDLVIMETLKNNLLYWFPDLQWFGLEDALKQFEQTMKSQTNLRIEGENLKVFCNNFKNTENILFPEFRMATNDVLVESFCKGTSLKDYLRQDNHPFEERKFMAKMGLRAFLKMIIIDNFVHADMHSGNILVNYDKLEKNSKKSNQNPNIVVLDVGLTTFASDLDLALIKDLFKAVGSNDSRGGAAVLMNYSTRKDMSDEDKEGFMSEMSAFFDAMYQASPSYYEGGKGLGEMLAIQRKYHVQHPGNLTTLIVGMIVLEGIGKQLYTDETRIFEDALSMLIEKKTKDNFFVKKYYQNKRKLQVWWEGETIKDTINLVPE